MPIKYNVVEIFTSEEARWQGIPVWEAVINHARSSGAAVRCIATKGFAGCYENGVFKGLVSRDSVLRAGVGQQ